MREVSRSVQYWIERILFEELELGYENGPSSKILLDILKTRPTDMIHRYVKGITQAMDDLELARASAEIIKMCTGLTSLRFTSGYAPSLDTINHLRPKRLCVDAGLLTLPEDPSSDRPNIAFTHPAFSEITHFELYDPVKDVSSLKFSDLPSLTHLSLNGHLMNLPEDVDVLRNILETCPHLEKLLVLLDRIWTEEETIEALKSISSPRLYAYEETSFALLSWDAIMFDGRDIWETIEEKCFLRSLDADSETDSD
jgi:hypothetical protein